MDPLTVFVASIVGALISRALRTESRLSEYYPASAEGTLETRGWVPMDGQAVRWWVEQGEAVWIEAKYLRPISGNIFDAEKLGAVARNVRERRRGDPSVEFYASYGQVRQISPEMVEESIRYAEYETGDSLTTGDRKLDRWLAREEDDKDEERDAEMEMRLARAVEDESGDLGKWSATVRDGNHRVFGAILGGEERIAIRLYDNDVQELRELVRSEGSVHRHSTAYLAEQMRLIRKAVEDSGLPHWLEEDRALELLPISEEPKNQK